MTLPFIMHQFIVATNHLPPSIGAANIKKIRKIQILMLYVHIYLHLGATDNIPPIYWCCKHFKNPQIPNIDTVCSHFFASWCNWQYSTQYIGAANTWSVMRSGNGYSVFFHMAANLKIKKHIHHPVRDHLPSSRPP